MVESSASSGNINIGTLTPNNRYINIGDINATTGYTNTINMGGNNDILVVKSIVQLGDAGSANGSTVINGNLRIITPEGKVNTISSYGSNIVESISANTGLLIVSGGVGISANTYVGGNIDIRNKLIVRGGIESTTVSSGTLIVTGGVGISANTYIGGNTDITNNLVVRGGLESTTISSGTLVVSGGVGVSANVYIGGNTNITGFLKLTKNTKHLVQILISHSEE
jgi:hypothetical protein